MKSYECCKNCYERHPLCHATCEKKAAADAEYEELKRKKAEKVPIMAYSRAKKEKSIRKRRQHRKQ